MHRQISGEDHVIRRRQIAAASYDALNANQIEDFAPRDMLGVLLRVELALQAEAQRFVVLEFQGNWNNSSVPT